MASGAISASKAEKDAVEFCTFLRGEWKTKNDMFRSILRGLRTAYYCASTDTKCVKAKIVGHTEAWCQFGRFICNLDPLKVPCENGMSHAAEEFKHFVDMEFEYILALGRLGNLSQLFKFAQMLSGAASVTLASAAFEAVVVAASVVHPHAARELVLACM
tara:strand:+ start:5890 stop:6369 length:480 start_codon:yes stop_codon:yes gene_type:complete